MNIEMMPWFIGFILIGVAMMVGIERLLRRYGAVPVDEDEHSRGFRDVLDRYRGWLERRRHGDSSTD